MPALPAGVFLRRYNALRVPIYCKCYFGGYVRWDPYPVIVVQKDYEKTLLLLPLSLMVTTTGNATPYILGGPPELKEPCSQDSHGEQSQIVPVVV